MTKYSKIVIITGVVLMSAAFSAHATGGGGGCSESGNSGNCHEDNGWGNGNDRAPGGSLPNNNAENGGPPNNEHPVHGDGVKN